MSCELPPVLVVKVWSSVPVTYERWELRRGLDVVPRNTPVEELRQFREILLYRIW